LIQSIALSLATCYYNSLFTPFRELDNPVVITVCDIESFIAGDKYTPRGIQLILGLASAIPTCDNYPFFGSFEPLGDTVVIPFADLN